MISHISILEAGKKATKKGESFPGQYEMRINLSSNPNEVWKQYFAWEWRKTSLARERKIKMDSNEFRIMLAKNDNIQSYIDTIKSAVNRANSMVKKYNEKKDKSRLSVDAKENEEVRRYKIKSIQ